jgi:hypothetical protein
MYNLVVKRRASSRLSIPLLLHSRCDLPISYWCANHVVCARCDNKEGARGLGRQVDKAKQ